MGVRQRIAQWKRRGRALFPQVIAGSCTCSGVAIFFVPHGSRLHPLALLIFCATAFAAIYENGDRR